MKPYFIVIFVCACLLSCKQEPKNPFGIYAEPLSTDAEVKASTWNGYSDFVFELKDLTENFSKEFAIEKTRNLLTKSQAILYSIPADLRNETTNEKASALVNTTKTLYNGMTAKSEDEITEGLKKIVAAYTALNKEINYYTAN